MLTSLNIITPEYKNGLLNFTNKIRGDSVYEELLQSGQIGLRRVTYISRSGKLKPKKLYKHLGKEAVVLADEGARLPCGITRFYDNSFSERLCVNMALGILGNIGDPTELRLGIYDPGAVAADFLLEALKLCRSPIAVTYDYLPYDRVRRIALEKLGAAAIITKNTKELKDCDLIIAPTRISAYVPVQKDAVVLTAGEPYIRLGGSVYHGYDVTLPPELEEIRPPELSAEYFGSAVYSLCRQYRLGSLVPDRCIGKNNSLTIKKLALGIKRVTS